MENEMEGKHLGFQFLRFGPLDLKSQGLAQCRHADTVCLSLQTLSLSPFLN